MSIYTKEQVENLKEIYSDGREIEVYLAVPRRGREFEAQSKGTVIEVNDRGILAQLTDINDEGRREYVQVLREGNDRFALVAPAGVGRALTEVK